ncbi:hypothetical protein M0805_004294 [Coniferiporia weirii]|nr:hypothetical protein M0805_004294 [Coniferiporia weirii]
MSSQQAVIRPYLHQDDDNKLVRFMVAKACMEPLAVANHKAMTNPWTIAVWIVLSSAFIQTMGWWPDPDFGFLGYLRPLPAFAAMSLPLIFLIDWYQRPKFDEQSVEVLKRPDIVNIKTYYARSPSSGLWLLEFGSKFVGLIAADASIDSQSDQTLPAQAGESPRKPKGKERKYSKDTASVATIRHFYVAETYRLASAQDDLLAFAIKHVFEESETVERIKATPSPYSTYLGRSLRDAGFSVTERGPKVGLIASRTTLTYELTREKWVESQKTE